MKKSGKLKVACEITIMDQRERERVKGKRTTERKEETRETTNWGGRNKLCSWGPPF